MSEAILAMVGATALTLAVLATTADAQQLRKNGNGNSSQARAISTNDPYGRSDCFERCMAIPGHVRASGCQIKCHDTPWAVPRR
jgi:hypothetical protein